MFITCQLKKTVGLINEICRDKLSILGAQKMCHMSGVQVFSQMNPPTY